MGAIGFAAASGVADGIVSIKEDRLIYWGRSAKRQILKK